MKNEYLDFEVGTVLKETYPNEVFYYIVGEYFIYCNDYDFPQIRPYKFILDEHISVANEDEKNQFIKDLKKNHLIWNKEIGKLRREFEEFNLSVKVQANDGTNINELIDKLNKLDVSSIYPEIKKLTFSDF